MIGLFFFYQAPAPKARRLEPPRNILCQQADEKARPDVKGEVSRNNKAGSADKAGQDEGNSDI